MLSDLFLLQVLAALTLSFFISTFNILSLWYLSGLYLVILGLWLFLDDGDIFVGFLWVIDLGVGLVFFIFILHYSTFMQQNSPLDKSSREISFLAALTLLTVLLFYFFAQPFDNNFNTGFSKSWFFFLSWYNYYDFFFSSTITDLNLLSEIYFYNNSFEFVLINFLLFYGIITSILLTFFINSIFAFSNFTQFNNLNMSELPNSTYFIRSQDFLNQQATSTGTSVWLKKKQSNPYDN